MSERLEKMMREANELENRLNAMTDKTSESYGIIFREYQDLMKTIKDETERLNSIEKVKQDSERLEIERDKNELNAQQARLSADLEEEKLRQDQKSFVRDVGKELVKGLVWLGVNGLLVYGMIRFNNSGETLTPFENKVINPFRLK